MQEFHNPPEIHIGLAHGRFAFGPIGFDEKEMTGAPHLKIEKGGAAPGGGPENLTLDAELSHDIAGLGKVVGRFRPGRRNHAFVVCLFAVFPVFMKRPGWMIEDQASEGKEPQEEDQVQAGVEVQFASLLL